MSSAVRSASTLSVLAMALVAAAVWGWSAATEPLPAKVETPLCVATSVSKGEKVFPEQVTVSVYNAGTRDGLAGRVMQQLTDGGFAEGNSGNVFGARVSKVEIWTAEPKSPAVRLVASRLGSAVRLVRKEARGVGVNVVVGDGFTDLVKGKRSVVAGEDTEICSPPVA